MKNEKLAKAYKEALVKALKDSDLADKYVNRGMKTFNNSKDKFGLRSAVLMAIGIAIQYDVDKLDSVTRLFHANLKTIYKR
jgi:hypothetical protein